MSRVLRLWCVVVALSIAMPGLAKEPPTETAKKVALELHKRATDAYQAGKRPQAIELWREALRHHEFWKYAYNLAHTLYEEGIYLESWTWVTRSESLGFPDDQPQLLDLLAALRVKVATALLRTHAWIQLDVTPADAVVKRDGAIWPAPRGLWTTAERSAITVEAPEYGTQDFVWEHPTGRRHTRAVVLESIRPGRVHVIGSPAGATVQIDGQDVGTLPWGPAELAPGEHVVRVMHQGFLTDTFEVTIKAGVLERVTIDLVEKPPEVKPPEPVYRDYTVAGWSTLGGGAALLGAGIGLLVWSESLAADLSDLSSPTPVPELIAQFGSYEAYLDERNSLNSQHEGALTAGWVLASVGGAAVVTGVVLLILNDPPPDAPEIGISPLPGGATVTGRVRF